MEVVGIAASVMGIITFIGSCIRMFKRLRDHFKKVPAIIQKILTDLKAAEPLLERAARTMQLYPYSSIVNINASLSTCERYVRSLSTSAEKAQEYKSRTKEFPHHSVPELEEQRERLGDGILKLMSDLRLLESMKPRQPWRSSYAGYPGISADEPYTPYAVNRANTAPSIPYRPYSVNRMNTTPSISPAERYRPHSVNRMNIPPSWTFDSLPYGWEERMSPQGIPYYVDHNTFRTTWTRPS